jgi:osmoprotectant transport system ATP-binding protein
VFELRAVRKRYGSAEALRGVDLRIATGQATMLIGSSGCGKSTLLRLLIGLVRPDEGQVLFDGRPIDERALPSLRRRTGFVVQEGGLFPHLTARDNAALMARELGWPREKIAARIDELSQLAHLPAQLYDRYPAQLSGGQRQRVALMRALMLDPDVLLLDEPLGALDPIIRAELQDDLQRVFAELHKTVVMVTHDLGEAGRFGGTLVLMRDGQIVQQGTLADLVYRPADPFVTRFVTAQRSPLEALKAGPPGTGLAGAREEPQ